MVGSHPASSRILRHSFMRAISTSSHVSMLSADNAIGVLCEARKEKRKGHFASAVT